MAWFLEISNLIKILCLQINNSDQIFRIALSFKNVVNYFVSNPIHDFSYLFDV